MPSVFDKLNLRAQREIVVIDAPRSFEPQLAALDGVAVVRHVAKVRAVHFALAFATRQADLDKAAKALCAKADGDALLWFAYPKKSSKVYRCEFDRDSGWEVLGQAGFEPVRMIAIDADWSALRFRRVEYILSLTRDPARAGSPASKLRTAPK